MASVLKRWVEKTYQFAGGELKVRLKILRGYGEGPEFIRELAAWQDGLKALPAEQRNVDVFLPPRELLDKALAHYVRPVEVVDDDGKPVERFSAEDIPWGLAIRFLLDLRMVYSLTPDQGKALPSPSTSAPEAQPSSDSPAPSIEPEASQAS